MITSASPFFREIAPALAGLQPDSFRDVTIAVAGDVVTLKGRVARSSLRERLESAIRPHLRGKQLVNEIVDEETACRRLRRHLVQHTLAPEGLPEELGREIKAHIEACPDCEAEQLALKGSVASLALHFPFYERDRQQKAPESLDSGGPLSGDSGG